MRHQAEIPVPGVLTALALALGLVAASAAAPDSQIADGAKTEKQLERINQQFMDLLNQEFDIAVKITEARQKTRQLLKEPGKAEQHLAQGKESPGLLRYKAVLIASAKKVQAFDRRLRPLLRQVQALQKAQEKAPKPVRTRIDQMAARLQSKHRSNLKKVARLYEEAGEWQVALRALFRVYSRIPENERDKDRELIKTIRELLNRAGNPQQSLAFHKSLFEAKDPKERYENKGLAKKVADLYAKTGNARQALLIYRRLLDHIPNDERHQAEREKILKQIRHLGGR